MTRRWFLSMAAAPAFAAPAWEKKPFPDWDAECRDHVLTDSPWARQVTVPFDYSHPASRQFESGFQIGLPGAGGWPSGIPGVGGGGWPGGRTGRTDPGSVPSGGRTGGATRPVRTENYLTIRWSSALPVRQALALEQWGRRGLDSSDARKLLEETPDEYIVGIGGFSVITLPKGAQDLEKQLAKSASILRKGHRPLRATSVTVPDHGNHLSAEIRFPRSEPIQPEDALVELVAEAGPMKIAAKFKLKDMFYRGRFEA